MTEQKHTLGTWVFDGDAVNNLKAFIAAALELSDYHRDIDETLTFALENGDMPANVRHSITVARNTARAAIAKAKGDER